MDRPAGIVEFTPDPELFPFESRWFDSSVGPIHYVDEGEGRPVVLLHGNPDWSFLYRRFVTALSGEFRCVVPDYPGFGLSAHPDGYGYTAAEHADVVAELIAHLGLEDMIIMGQDWGGPIGMHIASSDPDRVHGIVMGNTWYWPVDTRMMKTFSRLMGSRPLQYFITERNFFVNGLMKRTLEADLSDREFAHYRDVVPTPESRRGIAEFPKQILEAGPWLSEIAGRAPTALADKTMLLVFGRKDRALASEHIVDRWRTDFPSATYIDLPDASHYIQEDAPDQIIAAIRATFAAA